MVLCGCMLFAPVEMLGLLSAVASPFVEHRVQGAGFSSCCSRAPEQAQQVCCRLSCSAVCGIFPDQVSNPCLLHWQVVLYCWTTREAHEPFLRWLRKALRVFWVTKIKQLHNRNVHFMAPDIWHITHDVFSLPKKKNSCFQDGRNFLVHIVWHTTFWVCFNVNDPRFTEFSTKGYNSLDNISASLWSN